MNIEVCSTICKECPFSKSSLKGYFGQKDNRQYFEEIIEMWLQEKHYPCHLKIQKYYDFNDKKLYKIPLCRGYVAMYKNSFKVPRNVQLKELVDSFPPEEAKQYLSVFEFKSYHS